jgi:hypothetical protein
LSICPTICCSWRFINSEMLPSNLSFCWSYIPYFFKIAQVLSYDIPLPLSMHLAIYWPWSSYSEFLNTQQCAGHHIITSFYLITADWNSITSQFLHNFSTLSNPVHSKIYQFYILTIFQNLLHCNATWSEHCGLRTT